MGDDVPPRPKMPIHEVAQYVFDAWQMMQMGWGHWMMD
jgi:hypothetical protein